MSRPQAADDLSMPSPTVPGEYFGKSIKSNKILIFLTTGIVFIGINYNIIQVSISYIPLVSILHVLLNIHLALKTVRQGNRNKRLSSNTEFRTELYDTNKKKSEFSLIAQFFALSTSNIHIIDTYLQIINKGLMIK